FVSNKDYLLPPFLKGAIKDEFIKRAGKERIANSILSFIPRVASSTILHELSSIESRKAIKRHANILTVKDMENLNQQRLAYSGTNYLMPVFSRVVTELPSEIDQLESRLLQLGISEIRVGYELEFVLPDKSYDSSRLWIQLRDAIVSKLEGFDDERSKIVQSFSAREVLMFDLIENDPIGECLEPLFGVSRNGDGYYDAEGILELKVKHLPAQMAIKHLVELSERLYQRAAELRIPMARDATYHVNISFWDSMGNIFDPQHPKFELSGAKIAEGMTRLMYDALPALTSATHLNTLNLGLDRLSLLRFEMGRIELGLTDIRRIQDPYISLVMAMAGAVFGLEARGDIAEDIHLASTVFKGQFQSSEECKSLRHVLSNSEVTEDGFLLIPEAYVRDQIIELGKELGLSNINKTSELANVFGLELNYLEGVMQFLKKIRLILLEDSVEIVLPETSNGVYEFTSTLPSEFYKLPRNIRNRIYNGERVSVREIRPYLNLGDTIPRP
ncbi:hypothetical protein BVY03_00380, partial [bacterium K02(2017)]